jgi:hypothetical protein
VTLYCLLTGQAPFKVGDPLLVLHAVCGGDFAPPRRIDPSVDRA